MYVNDLNGIWWYLFTQSGFLISAGSGLWKTALRFFIILLPCKHATLISTRTSVHAKKLGDFQKGIMVCPYMLLTLSSYLGLYNSSEIYNSSVLPNKSLFTFQTAYKGQIGFAVKPLVENLLTHNSSTEWWQSVHNGMLSCHKCMRRNHM